MDQLEQVEISIEEAKKAIALKNTLIKLSHNPDFETLIYKGYFEDESVRLVMGKANPVMDTSDKQADIIKRIDAIGMLQQYFQAIVMRGDQMERSLADNEQTREEILAEDIS